MKKTRNEVKRTIKKRIEIHQNQHAFIDSKKNELKMNNDITRPDIKLSNDERTKLRGGNFHNIQIPKKTFIQLPNCPLECIITRKTKYNPFEGVRTMVLSKFQNQFKYNNTLVILSYNIDFNISEYREKYPNYKIVIYQLEQLYDNKSQWYNINSKNGEVVNRTKHIQKSLSECDEIWDYDLDNINFLKAEGFNNIIHVPLEYVSELIRTNNITNPEYELLFLGSVNDKRAKILSLLYDKYKICILAPEVDCNKYKNYNFGKCMNHSVFGDDLYKYVFNSKIIVNLHYYESNLQEQVRLFELLINGSVIVSEKSKRNYFGNLIYEFDNERDMFKKINLLLKNNIWKNNNISKRFKNKEYKRFKVGVAYNTFYGLELIEKSIKSIKNYVDYIVIVHQKIGFIGNLEPEENKQILERLLNNKLVNDIVYYDINDKDIQQGVLNKRNIGLDYCKKNDCTFIMPMDSDERYNVNELISEINFMYDNNIDTLYSPIYSYYYDENHYFKDTYFVASVLKIDNRKFEVTKSSVLVDSVRKMNEGTYKISEMYMHHYTYLKNSFSVKINNSVASTTDDSYVTISMKKIRDYLMSWSEGDEALVFANDVINGGIILIKIKLLNKLNSMKLIDYFNSNQNRNMIDKWLHYFDIYERHFSSFVGKKIKVLEIGIWQGGSLKMWKEYFGDQAEIIGVDIEPRCKKFEEERIKIYIGDQADTNFLHELIKSEGKFDIIIDDGGHYMHQQIISFQELYGALNDGGVYLCEDLHTNYWARYNGGYKKSLTFIEYTKNLIDELHSFYSEAPELKVTEFTKNTTGIHFYDSVVVFDRQKREKSTANNIGIKTIN